LIHDVLPIDLRARASLAGDAIVFGAREWVALVVACGHHSDACGLGAMWIVAKEMEPLSRRCATLRPFV
jgi:hypothetical protein